MYVCRHKCICVENVYACIGSLDDIKRLVQGPVGSQVCVYVYMYADVYVYIDVYACIDVYV